MNHEQSLYQRDPQAWREHLAEGNAKQARKRVGADALLHDQQDRILLVDPKYKPDWDMPGGMAEANEPPVDALRRELKEELGLDIPASDMALLCLDWVSPHGPWDDSLMFIFDAGTLTAEQIARLRLADSELAAYEFCTLKQAQQRLRPYVWQRVHAALEALNTHHVAYLHDGHPACATPQPGE
ncbi:MAG: NUDIX domain-containing protein [Pseudonocardiaceae bacterium]